MKSSRILLRLGLSALLMIKMTNASEEAKIYSPWSYDESLYRQGPRCDDCLTPFIQLRAPFHFFDTVHTRLAMSSNGYLVFDKVFLEFMDVCSEKEDMPPIIAPFWADALTRSKDSKTFYLESVDDEDTHMRVTEDILLAYPEFDELEINWVFIASWNTLRSFLPTGLENDVQVALASDGIYSFALFHYDYIQWTHGELMGKDDAFAGYKNPYLNISHQLNGSCTPEVRNLALNSNTGKPGTYVLRLDNHKLFGGAPCEDFEPGSELISKPTSVSVSGGQEMHIKGPCIPPKSSVFCTFYDGYHGSKPKTMRVEAFVQDKDNIFCFVPPLYQLSRIKYEVSFENEQHIVESHNGTIQLLSPPHNEKNSFTLTANVETGNFSLFWDKNNFPDDSEVIFCRFARWDQQMMAWDQLEKVETASPIQNSGEAEIPIAAFLPLNTVALHAILKPAGDSCTPQHKEIVLNGRIVNPDALVVPAFDTDEQRLDKAPWTRKTPKAGCDFSKYPKLIPGIEVDHCPPTRHLAKKDDRFKHYRSKNADGGDCYLQKQPFFGKTSAQFCCYTGNLVDCTNEDRRNFIASHPFLFHPEIHATLHVQIDKLAFLWCCKLGNKESCDPYFSVRPLDCGYHYEPPTAAGSGGDPHFNTPDGLEYTFNGHGEYVLTRYRECDVQVRLEKYVKDGGNIIESSGKGTVFSGIAFQCLGNEIVEVKLSSVRDKLEIWIDGERFKFPEALNEINMHSVVLEKISSANQSLADSSYRLNLPRGTVSISLELEDGMVNMIYSFMCEKFQAQFQGLLGNCDFNKDNDLTSRAGQVLSPNASMRDVHYKFGETWRVTKEESLFTYNTFTYEQINDLDFVPLLDVEGHIPADVLEICEGVKQCEFDFLATDDIEFAAASKIAKQKLEEIIEESNAWDRRQCPEIAVKNGHVTYVGNRRINSTATIHCDENMELVPASSIVSDDEKTLALAHSGDIASLAVCQEDMTWTLVPCCRMACPRDGQHLWFQMSCQMYRIVVQDTVGWC